MHIVSSEYELTVSFEDLDPMNIVWHGNYLRYLERARCDLFAKLNYTYMDMKDDGIMYPIAKIKMKYIKPAFFGDILKIETAVTSAEPVLEIKYKIYNQKTGEKIFEAETMQIAMDIKTRESVFNVPERFINKLKGAPDRI